MPQFAIYRNPGRNRDIPFVVQIQSNRLERSVGRVVMPLVRRSGSAPPNHPLTPHLHVEGEEVFANPFDLATVPTSRLGAIVGVLPEHDQDMIIRALDELVSRA
ncbi:CcdB cytotoxin-like protein [Gluconobacter oxydans]|uniref:CcdB family protein n=1 Tax=Gluconobacter thailandicus TaxID=257438 RepID=UPI0002998384|nr:CcdB family protein [Gluconobacter thailandicus]AFW02845.1 Putative CcdB cytotoxin-like protein [Gluconobacter oxydans H24]ANQ41730.1 CcdB cytotoxin-like protein [Gluconobacter oxydans]